MTKSNLEHVNFTVSDPDKTAAMLCELFDWKIRWAGASLGEGRSVHVGTQDNYVALYSPANSIEQDYDNYAMRGGLNHIGIVVDDFEATLMRIQKAGYKTHNHSDYEPGQRFYFNDHDGIEFEVINYPES